jgi:hypothetical protein
MTSYERSGSANYIGNPAHFSNYVIAVIEDREEAERAAAALHTAGFAQDAIVLSPEVDPRATPLQESEGMEHSLAEPPTTAEKLFTEEGLDQELYATERARGHVVVRVRTENDTNVESARKELATHHAYAIRHVGKWMGETLSDAPDGAR